MTTFDSIFTAEADQDAGIAAAATQKGLIA
jgi:hypothetical protein